MVQVDHHLEPWDLEQEHAVVELDFRVVSFSRDDLHTRNWMTKYIRTSKITKDEKYWNKWFHVMLFWFQSNVY